MLIIYTLLNYYNTLLIVKFLTHILLTFHSTKSSRFDGTYFFLFEFIYLSWRCSSRPDTDRWSNLYYVSWSVWQPYPSCGGCGSSRPQLDKLLTWPNRGSRYSACHSGVGRSGEEGGNVHHLGKEKKKISITGQTK